MTTAVEIVELEKAFDPSGLAGELRRLVGRPVTRVAALRRVTLRVARGEIYGVVGSNGSGKSTLARIVATLLTPDAGRARVFGRDVERESADVRRLLNRVSVDASFFKKLSPLENLVFSGRLYDLPPRAAEPRVRQILQRLGISGDPLTRPVEQMSRGMQQKVKVAVARAFLTSPVLLVLDEPTTGLDPASKRDVQAFIQEVRDSHDATVLLMSHDMDEIARLCDRMAVLDDGRIVAEGTPESLAAPGETLEDAFIRLTGHALGDTTNGRSARLEPAGVGEETRP
ncbi:MAG: ABC transporter ATP-binding protein [Chloroflexi bacterium]|nr:ABC transporter ATP-binding protein [Chloroflexota bacterium]